MEREVDVSKVLRVKCDVCKLEDPKNRGGVYEVVTEKGKEPEIHVCGICQLPFTETCRLVGVPLEVERYVSQTQPMGRILVGKAVADG